MKSGKESMEGVSVIIGPLVTGEIADLVRITLLVEVFDTVVAVVRHLIRDLAVETPAGFFAKIIFPVTIAFLPLAPAVNTIYLTDNAVYNAEGIASIVSSTTILDCPPSSGRLVKLLG